MLNTFWLLAYRNLLRNRRRSAATALAVVFGFVGLLLLGAYIFRAGMALQTSTIYLNQKGHFSIRKTGALESFITAPKKYGLDLEDQEKIIALLKAQESRIDFYSKYLNGAALLNDGEHSIPVIITGIEPENYSRLLKHPQVYKWSPEWIPPVVAKAPEDMQTENLLISITTNISRQLGRDLKNLAPQRDVQLVAQNYFRDLSAVDAELGATHSTGVAFTDDTSVFARLDLLQNLLSTDNVEYIAVFLNNTRDTDVLAQMIRSQLGSNYEIHTFEDEKWSSYYIGTMNFLYVMGIFFALTILGAVSLAIINTTTLNLLERMRELGTLRAIGFRPRHVQDLFFREAILLGTICIAIGLVGAFAVAAVVNSLNLHFEPPGAQGAIQFRLVLNLPITLGMACLVMGLVLVCTRIVVARESKRAVISLLGETGA